MWVVAAWSRGRAARLDQQLGAARTARDLALEHAQDLQARLASALEERDGLRTTRTALQDEVEHLQGENARLNTARDDAVRIQLQLRTELGRECAAVSEMRSAKAALRADLTAADAARDAAERAVARLQERLEAAVTERDGLRGQLGDTNALRTECGQLRQAGRHFRDAAAHEQQARQAAEAQAATLRAELNAVEEENGDLQQQLDELQTLVGTHGRRIPLCDMPAGHVDARGRALGNGYTQDANGRVRRRGKFVSNAEAAMALAA